MDWVQTAVETLSGNSLRQIVHTHFTSVHQTAKLYVHQTAKLVAALLRVARVTAGLAESYGSLPRGSWLTSPAGWLPRTGISSGTLCSVIEYGLPFYGIQIDLLISSDCFAQLMTRGGAHWFEEHSELREPLKHRISESVFPPSEEKVAEFHFDRWWDLPVHFVWILT